MSAIIGLSPRGISLVILGGILLAGVPTTTVAAAGSECVYEVKEDAFWKNYYNDTFLVPFASGFAAAAASKHWIVDTKPAAGDVVVWQAGAGAPGARASSSGHVAIVTAVRGNKIDVRERNWGTPPSGAGTPRPDVTVVDGMSFVHRQMRVPTVKTEQYQSGTRTERYQSGTRTERYQSGTRTERYQSGTRTERYQSGTRTERYQSGWRDQRTTRNRRMVTERQPVFSTRQVPVFSTRQVPVFSTRQVQTGTTVKTMP